MAGRQLSARGSFTWSVLNTQRETKAGADGIHGFGETPVAPFIEGPITLNREVTMAFLGGIDGHTIQLDLDDARSVVLEEGWLVGQPSADTGEGQATVRFEARSGREI